MFNTYTILIDELAESTKADTQGFLAHWCFVPIANIAEPLRERSGVSLPT
jgi:hypothetical protein